MPVTVVAPTNTGHSPPTTLEFSVAHKIRRRYSPGPVVVRVQLGFANAFVAPPPLQGADDPIGIYARIIRCVHAAMTTRNGTELIGYPRENSPGDWRSQMCAANQHRCSGNLAPKLHGPLRRSARDPTPILMQSRVAELVRNGMGPSQSNAFRLTPSQERGRLNEVRFFR